MTVLPLQTQGRAQPWRLKDGRFATDVGEREFLARVQNSENFWKSVNGLSKATGMEVDALEGHAQEIIRSVWPEADAVMASDGPLAAAREEVSRLKAKLNECNLSAIKQMAADKHGNHSAGELGGDTITFHEPMHYVDQSTKALVMSIVCDKMRQLENNTAPPSLVQALVQHAKAQAEPGESASMEELRETRAQLEDTRVELRKARLRMEEAEELSRQFEMRLREAEDRARKFEQELEETRTILVATQAKLAEAERALVELRAEHEALQAEHAKLQELSARQQAEIEKLGRELEVERRETKRLRAEVERLQEYVRRAEQLERELKALQARFNELEKEANEMREELARRNNTRTKGTQTSLTGSKLDEQAAERRKLKLMLEELQTKMKELMTEYRRKFGSDATKIAEDLGIQELIKEETVFQRLYDDAMDRVHRLEKLRARVKKERKSLCSSPGSPRSVAADLFNQPDVPILEAVEQHQPTAGMRRLIKDLEIESEQTPSQNASTWATRAPKHDQGCGDGEIGEDVWNRLTKQSPPVMKTSTSLPSLPRASQHISMLNLDLGGGRRSSKRNF